MIFWLIVLVLSSSTLFCVYKLVYIIRSYQETSFANSKIRTIAVSENHSTSEPQEEDAEDAKSEVPIIIDWDKLKNINSDIIAWLYCEGTSVNYPVVQAKDNEYYLSRQFDKTKSSAGSLFLDCRNNILSRDENLIIYGHRMKDDSMFGIIPMYADEDYYLDHPIMYLLTPEQNYVVKIFACRTVNGDMNHLRTFFEDRDAFNTYINSAVKQSYWMPDIDLATEESILTLVTCSSYKHASKPRILVHGILEPIA